MTHWLIKSEESCYSLKDLKRDKKTSWGGVRNYQARNFMKQMQVGDLCLFYHSSSTPTGVAGVCRVIKSAHADATAFDKNDEHYDPKSTPEKPIWECVDVAYVTRLKEFVTLACIKIDPTLAGIIVAQQGSRLSVQPLSQKHFEYIVRNLGETKI